MMSQDLAEAFQRFETAIDALSCTQTEIAGALDRSAAVLEAYLETLEDVYTSPMDDLVVECAHLVIS